MNENELNEIREIRKRILELIGQAKTERAISLLKEFLETKNPALYSSLVLISNRFHELKQKQTLGLSFEGSHLNDVNYDLINFVNGLESNIKRDTKKNNFSYKKYAGIVGFSLFGLVVIWWSLGSSELGVNEDNSAKALSIASALISEDISLRAVKVNPKTIPIKFKVDYRKNTLKLVYYDTSIKRNDTFEINTDWQIYDLKQEIIRYYELSTFNPLLFCRGEPLYYRGEGGEYISLNYLMERGDVREYDKIRINPGGLANIETNPINFDNKNLLAYNPTGLAQGDIDYFKFSVPTSGQLSIDLENGFNLDNDAFLISWVDDFERDEYYISQKIHHNQNTNKKKRKKYIVTSKFGIIEENEIFIVYEFDECKKNSDEEE